MSAAISIRDCECECPTTCCCALNADEYLYAALEYGTNGVPDTPCDGADLDIYAYPDATFDYLNLGVFAASNGDSVALPVASTSVRGVGITIDSDVASVTMDEVGVTFSSDMAHDFLVGDGKMLWDEDATIFTLTFDAARRVCWVCFFITGAGFTDPGGPFPEVTLTVEDDDGHTETVTANMGTFPFSAFNMSGTVAEAVAYQGRSITSIVVEITGGPDSLGFGIGAIALCSQPKVY